MSIFEKNTREEQVLSFAGRPDGHSGRKATPALELHPTFEYV
jgi:hypothetical protein